MISKKKKKSNIDLNFRYLKDNYWDCPIPDYSKILLNDYTAASKQCSNLFFYLFI